MTLLHATDTGIEHISKQLGLVPHAEAGLMPVQFLEQLDCAAVNSRGDNVIPQVSMVVLFSSGSLAMTKPDTPQPHNKNINPSNSTRTPQNLPNCHKPKALKNSLQTELSR